MVFWQHSFVTSADAIFVLNADGSELDKKLILSMPAPKADESRGKKWRRVPHQIEAGGFFPQWGPAVR